MAFSKPPHTTTWMKGIPTLDISVRGAGAGEETFEVMQRLMILSEALTREGDVKRMRRLWLDVLDAESVLENMKGCRV